MPVIRNSKLVEAIKTKRVEQVIKQLEKGKSATEKSGGETPLYVASRIGELAIVRALVEHGAQVNEPSQTPSDNKIPVLIASEKGYADIVQYLIEHGADPNASSIGGTPLYYACRNNKAELVKFLVEHGADVNKPTIIGQIPLLAAIETDTINSVRYLLDHGADLTIRYRNQTLLIHAIENNKILLALLLLDYGVDANEPSSTGVLPITLALANKNLPLISSLLDHGVDPNRALPDGKTLLAKAIESKNMELVKVLLKHGADQSIPLPSGKPPFITAIEKGNLELLKVLIANGANPNAPLADGKTPLAMAIEIKKPELIKALLASGADRTIPLPNGKTPFTFAIETNDDGLLNILLASGADPNTPLPNGKVPLAVAIETRNIQQAWTLLRYRANQSIQLSDGNTPLSLAIDKVDIGLLKILLTFKPDLTMVFPNGETPLTMAIDKYNSSLIDVLLQAGADINQPLPSGETPLIAAIQRGKLLVIPTLLEAGADINQPLPTGETPFFIACELQKSKPVTNKTYQTYKDLVYLLLKNPRLDKSALIYGKTMAQHAEGGRFSEDVNLLLTAETRLWKGWTTSNAEKLDTVFEAETNEYSVCPVCLKFSEREDGCMYMHHNCSENPGYYSVELYNKYKSESGSIWWCTICNRICMGHHHYELGLANGPRPKLVSSSSPFEKDCRLRNGGGGPPEKINRFRGLRERAYQLQSAVGSRTAKSVMDDLVKAMWDAPLTTPENLITKISTEKKWNIPSTVFPAYVKPPEEVEGPLPNIVRPKANAENPDLQPILLENKPNAVNLGEIKPQVVQFRHRMQNGTINTHEGEYIGTDTLEGFIKDLLPKFGTEEFGMCWNYAGGCTARLYPEEVKPFLTPETYEKYRVLFNKKYKTGGARRKLGRRKTQKRRQKGGNLFMPLTNGTCYLASNKSTRNRRR